MDTYEVLASFLNRRLGISKIYGNCGESRITPTFSNYIIFVD